MRRARRAPDKVSTSHTRPIVRNYNKRLTRRKIRQYKRNLWIASTAMQKFRVIGTGSEVISTPANISAYTVKDYRMFKHPLDITSPSNWIDDSGDRSLTLVGSNMVLRGGEWNMTLAHENAENIDYRVYLCWYKKNSSLVSGSVDKALAPHGGNDTSNDVKTIRVWQGTIPPSSSVRFSHKLGIKMVDIGRSVNYEDQPGFVVMVGNTVTGTAVDVTAVLSVSVSVCGDVITAT